MEKYQTSLSQNSYMKMYCHNAKYTCITKHLTSQISVLLQMFQNLKTEYLVDCFYKK